MTANRFMAPCLDGCAYHETVHAPLPGLVALLLLAPPTNMFGLKFVPL